MGGLVVTPNVPAARYEFEMIDKEGVHGRSPGLYMHFKVSYRSGRAEATSCVPIRVTYLAICLEAAIFETIREEETWKDSKTIEYRYR